MNKNSRGLTSLLIISALALIGIAVFAIFQSRLTTLKTPSVNQEPNGNLTSWKTYRNEEYGFEIKYPQDWRVEDRIAESNNWFGIKEIYAYTGPVGYNPQGFVILSKDSQSPLDSMFVRLDILRRNKDNSLVGPIPENLFPSYDEKFNYSLGNAESTVYKKTSTYYRETKPSESINLWTIPFRGDIYYYIAAYSRNNLEENTMLLLKILSTFKFIDDNHETTQPITGKGCVIGGCSSEICAEEEMFSTCILRPEAVCYKSASCERQSDGTCDWTQTEELSACLAEYQ